VECKDRGLVIGRGLFWFSFPMFYPVAYKEWPVFEYLDSNYGAILGGLGDKRKVVYSIP
jgi:hypothetical protein